MLDQIIFEDFNNRGLIFYIDKDSAVPTVDAWKESSEKSASYRSQFPTYDSLVEHQKIIDMDTSAELLRALASKLDFEVLRNSTSVGAMTEDYLPLAANEFCVVGMREFEKGYLVAVAASELACDPYKNSSGDLVASRGMHPKDFRVLWVPLMTAAYEYLLYSMLDEGYRCRSVFARFQPADVEAPKEGIEARIKRVVGRYHDILSGAPTSFSSGVSYLSHQERVELIEDIAVGRIQTAVKLAIPYYDQQQCQVKLADVSGELLPLTTELSGLLSNLATESEVGSHDEYNFVQIPRLFGRERCWAELQVQLPLRMVASGAEWELGMGLPFEVMTLDQLGRQIRVPIAPVDLDRERLLSRYFG